MCGKRRVGDQGMGNGAKGIGKSDYSRRVLTRTRYGKDELWIHHDASHQLGKYPHSTMCVICRCVQVNQISPTAAKCKL